MTVFDRRLTPARPDLAAEGLRGRVAAQRYVAGVWRQVVTATAPLRARPALDAGYETEALLGERVQVFDEEEGWAWGQLEADGYVGYLPAAMLGPEGLPPDHRLAVSRSFFYPAPDIKTPPQGFAPLGGLVSVLERRGSFARTAEGWLWGEHLWPLDRRATDFVAVAETFLGAPYLWGGKSALGLDCSALVQLSAGLAGMALPRDSDLQQTCGQPVAIAPGLTGLRRGDLVFWKGHVGIMRDPQTLLHATGHSMLVVEEPLAVVAGRIETALSRPIAAIRRLT